MTQIIEKIKADIRSHILDPMLEDQDNQFYLGVRNDLEMIFDEYLHSMIAIIETDIFRVFDKVTDAIINHIVAQGINKLTGGNDHV